MPVLVRRCIQVCQLNPRNFDSKKAVRILTNFLHPFTRVLVLLVCILSLYFLFSLLLQALRHVIPEMHLLGAAQVHDLVDSFLSNRSSSSLEYIAPLSFCGNPSNHLSHFGRLLGIDYLSWRRSLFPRTHLNL